MSRLSAEARRSGKSFKAVVNEALRRGLDQTGHPAEPFRVIPRNMGVRPGIQIDDIEGLLDQIEGPNRR